MAWSVLGQRSKPTGAYAGGFKIARPAGAAKGCLLVALVDVHEFPPGAITGSNFTQRQNAANGVDRWAIFEKEDDGSQEFEVTWSGTREGQGFLIAFSPGLGKKAVYDISSIRETSASKSIATTGITVAEAAELLVNASVEDHGLAMVQPAGFTEIVDEGTEETHGTHVAWKEQGAGATGEQNFKEASSNIAGFGILIAWKAVDATPTATTEAASGVGQTEATVNGKVNPNGQATTYWFEYGTTEGLGSKTTTGSAGEGSSDVAKSKGLSGLSPGTKYFFRLVAENAAGKTEGSILNFTTEAEPGPEPEPGAVAGAVPTRQGVRVVAIIEQGAGIGYDLTDEIEGLGWSSVNPGGDETCTFALKRPWFADAPELERGNLLRVLDGVDVLWQGRVEELDRSAESAEEIGVTAYGLGARLKDQTMRGIYVDSSQTRWQGMTTRRRIAYLEAPRSIADAESTTDPVTGAPALETAISDTWADLPRAEGWYDSQGIGIGMVGASWRKSGTISAADTNYFWQIELSPDDVASAPLSGSGNLRAAGPGEVTILANDPSQTWAMVQLGYQAKGGEAGRRFSVFWILKVVGTHGIPLTEGGLTVSQMVVDAVEGAAGVKVRRVDGTGFVCRQATYFDPTQIEGVVEDLNRFEKHQRTYGTWGPDSPLDSSIDGYFDYRSIDTEPSWIVYRSDCDSCNLHSETASLFDTVHVSYTDESGVQRMVTRSANVPDLNGIPRETTVNLGKGTQAGAEALGDAVLALSGSFAPARGSIVRSQPMQHVDRGMLPAHYARADGSAIAVPDILPARSLFALDSSPNRRTTFPIKRVSVNAADKAAPATTIEVDQTNDSLSALTARLAEEAEVGVG